MFATRLTGAMGVLILGLAVGVSAQTQVPAAPQAPVFVESQDANKVRSRLREVLREYPPTVGQVLALDNSLLRDANYLAPYPRLAAFLSQHPEVARNPSYYFESMRGIVVTPRDPTAAQLNQLVPIVVVPAIFGFFAFLVYSLVGYRRWSRGSRMQVEAHSRLLEKLTSSADLLTYMQTPAGQRFLEAAALPLGAAASAPAAPAGRILSSVQAGVVLICAGGGLSVVGRGPVVAFGVVVLAVGIGFVLSSAASYVISRRLGILESGPPNA
jgi:hypothetical protein